MSGLDLNHLPNLAMNNDDKRERWWGHLLEALPDVFELLGEAGSLLGEVVGALFSALLELLCGL